MTALVERLFEDRTGELAEDFPDHQACALSGLPKGRWWPVALCVLALLPRVTPSRLRKTVIVALAVVPEECAGEA
jgi:hypothetical protein